MEYMCMKMIIFCANQIAPIAVDDILQAMATHGHLDVTAVDFFIALHRMNSSSVNKVDKPARAIISRMPHVPRSSQLDRSRSLSEESRELMVLLVPHLLSPSRALSRIFAHTLAQKSKIPQPVWNSGRA